MSQYHDDNVQFTNGLDDSQAEETTASQARPRENRSAPKPTQLSRLREIMSSKLDTPPCNIPVPLRSGLSLDIEIEGLTVNRMENYTKRATASTGNRRSRRNKEGERLDQLLLASLVLHNHCVAIRIDGEIVTDSNGNNLHITDHEFLSMLDVISEDDVSAIMTEIFGMEIHVLNAFGELQEYLEETGEINEGAESPLAN